ncbi:MAG: BspA family leucine-rich repeat surface protein [Coriobacteriia bacterium]|nr:BspA family leucine-rich repeat surface protein [Coriobacteriia bacterium]
MQEYDGFESTAYMCANMKNANDIAGFEYLDVSKVTDMKFMFRGYGLGSTKVDTKINSVPDVSSWNTSNVRDMNHMFESYGQYSSELNQAPICAHVDDSEVWDLSNITDMSNMFQYYGQYAKNLNVVPDVSNWDFSSNLQDVNLSGLFQFYAAGKITTKTIISVVPNVSEWKTNKVTNMENIFYTYGANSSGKLEFLDLSSFTVNSSTRVFKMFTSMPLHSFSLGPGWFGPSMADAGLRNVTWYKPDGTELFPADIPGDTRLTEKTTYTDTKPAPPVEWTPMTAASGDAKHSVINFYPAFNDAKEIEGYEFGVYNNGEVVRIAPTTMQDIYNELESLEDKTLYYKKTDASAQALKCYTEINKPWNEVFSKSTEEKGKADGYYTDFINNYVVFEIYTAELGKKVDEYFGEYWDSRKRTPDNSPTVNKVSYRDFWSCYFRLFSEESNFTWGSYKDDQQCWCCNPKNNKWTMAEISAENNGVVLAKEFGTS